MIKVESINSLNYKKDSNHTKIEKSNHDRLCLF